jgi:hypothetical protein
MAAAEASASGDDAAALRITRPLARMRLSMPVARQPSILLICRFKRQERA